MDFNYNKDIIYKIINNITLSLDIIVPKGLKEPAPCVVWFHGGGWREGSKDDIGSMPFLPGELLSSGICIVSVEYRLVDKNGGGFSQSVSDAKDAIEFVKTLSYIDKNKIFTGGISAGAYLALETAMLYKTLNVRGVLSFSGITFMRGCDTEFSKLNVYPITQGFIDGFLKASQNKIDSTVNPSQLLFTCDKSISFFVVHGDMDECVNVQSTDEFVKRTKNLGFEIEYVRINNSNHTFFPVGNPISPPLKQIMKAATEFVKKCS